MKKNLGILLVAGFLCSLGTTAQETNSQGLLKNKIVYKAQLAKDIKNNQELWSIARPTNNFVINSSQQPTIKQNLSSTAEGTVVLNEDFAKCTAGSESNPDSQDISRLEERGMNIPGNYTNQVGWMGDKVYQAGGCLYFSNTYFPGATVEEDIYFQGCLYTPVIDLSANNGIFTIKFRARTVDKESDNLRILTYVQDDEYYRYVDDENTVTISNEWKDYTISLQKGGQSNRICFLTTMSQWLIDYVIIESSGMQPPVVSEPTNYTGTEVTMNWEPHEEATSYLVDLYYKDENKQKVYLLKDVETTETSLNASNLIIENTYYYTVRGKKEESISPYSEEMAILSELPSPDLLPCTEYTGDSFVANWEPVEGATSYLVSVYYLVLNNYMLEPQYYIYQQETTETSLKIEGCDPHVTYYYTVQSKGAGISIAEFVMPAVPRLSVPELSEPTDITTNSFVANWKEVPYSERYAPYLFKEHTALEDESYTLIDTDFSEAECPPSYEPWGNMTIDEPYQSFRPYYFDEFAGMADWYINQTAFADGALGIDNMYPDFFDLGYMISPELDFSTGDGTATIDVNWMSLHASPTDEVYAIVSFATVGPDKTIQLQGDPQSFLVPEKELKKETITLTGGTKDSYIIVYTENAGIIMLDDFKVSLNINKGEKQFMPITTTLTEATSLKFDNLENKPGDRYAYKVASAYIGDGTYPFQTAFSDYKFVELQSSVSSETVKAEANAYVRDNRLFVNNPNHETVTVYAINGNLLFTDNTRPTVGVYDLHTAGMYIVKVGNKAIKVVK